MGCRVSTTRPGMWVGSRGGPRGSSDHCCGCSWIVLVTSGFRGCKRSSSAVIFGCLDGFCDHKVSKRSAVSIIADLARWCSCGVPSGSAPGWRVVALREVDGTPHPARSTQPQQSGWLAIPETCLPGEGMVWLGPTVLADVAPIRLCQRRRSTAVQRCGLSHSVSGNAYSCTVGEVLSVRAGGSP